MKALSTSPTALERFFGQIGVPLVGIRLPRSGTGWNAGTSSTAIRAGGRNNEIARLAGQLISRGHALAEVKRMARAANGKFQPPLDDAEVDSVCESIWRTDERANGTPKSTSSLRPLFDIQDARIDSFLATQPPPRRWLMQGFIPLGIVAAIVSPGGTGKSQLLLQLAYSVATGKQFAGKWHVGEQGSVLMLCGEDDRDEIHRRIARIHGQLGLGATQMEIDALCSRLYIKSLVGEDVQLTAIGDGNEAVKTEICARLDLTIQQMQDVKLIIVDPASRFRGGDENSNTHATRFVQALEGFARDSGATVLIAHHASKAASYGSEVNQNSSRGASALADGIRLQLALSSIAKSKSYESIAGDVRREYLELAVVKTNYTAMPLPTLLHRDSENYLSANPVQAAGVGSGTATIVATVALLQTIDALRSKATARYIEQNCCGDKKRIDVSQKECRALIEAACADSLVLKCNRRPLTVTAKGYALLSAHTKTRGAARRRGASPHAA